MDHSNIGNRMKSYEDSYRFHLPPRMPVILRLDGCSFHSYTKGFEKPWDPRMRQSMIETTSALINRISGAEFAYTQSDEISILVNTYKNFNTKPWFDNNLSKLVSVSASIATATFNKTMLQLNLASGKSPPKAVATFDSRAFVVPREDVVNYFFWRQLDCIRNSISSLAQSNFSHNQLFKKSCNDMKLMLKELGKDWETYSTWDKYGICVHKTKEENGRTKIIPCAETSVFSSDSSMIKKALEQLEE